MSKVHNGAIILMHPTFSTEQSLDQLITQIKAKNLQIDTVSELMSEERVLNQSKDVNKVIRIITISQVYGKNKINSIYFISHK